MQYWEISLMVCLARLRAVYVFPENRNPWVSVTCERRCSQVTLTRLFVFRSSPWIFEEMRNRSQSMACSALCIFLHIISENSAAPSSRRYFKKIILVTCLLAAVINVAGGNYKFMNPRTSGAMTVTKYFISFGKSSSFVCIINPIINAFVLAVFGFSTIRQATKTQLGHSLTFYLKTKYFPNG